MRNITAPTIVFLFTGVIQQLLRTVNLVNQQTLLFERSFRLKKVDAVDATASYMVTYMRILFETKLGATRSGAYNGSITYVKKVGL